jgi:glycosyltransferase involved in cell wall biosynthesis
MPGTILYSIIIPTYNSQQWIDACIGSVLAQTYPHFNVLVIDSGSTDATLQKIEGYADSRIQIYRTPQRLDIVANWQRITSLPRNEYMTILGHDDLLYPQYLQTITGLIQAHPGASLYHTAFDFIDENGRVIRPCKNMLPQYSAPLWLQAVLQNQLDITATGYMYRSAVYDAVGGIPPYPDLLYADIVLWHRITALGGLVNHPARCVGFRTHRSNTSKSYSFNKLQAFEDLLQYLAQLQQGGEPYSSLIQQYGQPFLAQSITGLCHKLLYVPPAKRRGVTLSAIIDMGSRAGNLLLPGTGFNPAQLAPVRLARLIDATALGRQLFVWLKSFTRRVY